MVFYFLQNFLHTTHHVLGATVDTYRLKVLTEMIDSVWKYQLSALFVSCQRNLSATQGFPDFGSKVFHRERFLNEMHARIQYAMVSDDVGGVA